MRITRLTALRNFKLYRKLEDLWGSCVAKVFGSGCCLLEYQGKVRFDGLFIVLQNLKGPPLKIMDNTLFTSSRQHLYEIHQKGVTHDLPQRQSFSVDFGYSTSISYQEEEEEQAWYKPDGEVKYFDLDSDSSKLSGFFEDSYTPRSWH